MPAIIKYFFIPDLYYWLNIFNRNRKKQASGKNFPASELLLTFILTVFHHSNSVNMISQRFIGICLAAVALGIASCHDEDKPAPEPEKPGLKEENITYTGDGITMNGFVVYDSTRTDKRPAVLVVHEWWGLNDYSKKRARELADLGYIAMALDMYGNGKTADNPDSANKYSVCSRRVFNDEATPDTR